MLRTTMTNYSVFNSKMYYKVYNYCQSNKQFTGSECYIATNNGKVKALPSTIYITNINCKSHDC